MLDTAIEQLIRGARVIKADKFQSGMIRVQLHKTGGEELTCVCSLAGLVNGLAARAAAALKSQD